MRTFRRILPAVTALCFCLLPISSAWSHAIESGTVEVNFTFGYSHRTVTIGNLSDQSVDTVIFNGFVGYFLHSMHELLFAWGVNHSWTTGADTTVVELGPGYRFNLTNISDIVVPYVGGGGGLAYIEEKWTTPFGFTESMSEVGFLWTVGGGVRFLVTKNVSLNFGVSYYEAHFSHQGESIKISLVPVSAGFSVLF